MADNHWNLGQTSIQYETGGRGASTISTGKGDRGGVSYGAYQLSSKMGTLQEYLDQSPYKSDFSGLTPTTAEFNAKWRELAKNDPGFAKDQHEFIKETHFNIQDSKLKAQGIDLSNRGPAVQDALWSTSVQFRGLTPGIFSKGLEEKFGKDYKLAELSDKDIVGAVQDYKINHNNQLFSKSPSLWPGLLERAKNEKTDLIALANDRTVTNNGPTPTRSENAPVQAHPLADGLLKFGEHGQDVEGLQRSLNQLGIRDANGKPLKPDGDFGIHTREAVIAFQTANGLKVDGLAGKETLEAIGKKLPEGKVTVERAEVTGLAPQQAVARTPLVSDPSHPSNPLYTAIGQQLPAGTKQEVTANVTLQAMENGITSPDKLKGVVVKDGDAFVAGNNPGDRVKVDLSAPTPDLQQMSKHMQAESVQLQQQRTQPDPQVAQAR